MNVELLEAREVPATLNYIGPDGGYWNVGANWNLGYVPTSIDNATISLSSNASVIIPSGYTATVSMLNSTARLGVVGTLKIGGNSFVSGEFDVNGTVWVGPAAPPSGGDDTPGQAVPPNLTLTGGGDVVGRIDTAVDCTTTIGANQVRVVGSGSLTGDGWFRVTGPTAQLSFNGDPASVPNLYAGGGSMLDGTANINVTSTFILEGATVAGPANSMMTNLGQAHVLAPVPGGTNVIRRNFTNAADAECLVDGDITLGNGALWKNLGVVGLSDQAASITFRAGTEGGGSIVNDGAWYDNTPLFRSEVPFTNRGVLDAEFLNGPSRVVQFVDFVQQLSGPDKAAPEVLLAWGAELRLGKGRIEAGRITANTGNSEDPRGKMTIDSTLSPAGSAEVTFTTSGVGVFEVNLVHLQVVSDAQSRVVIAPSQIKSLRFDRCVAELNGATEWVSGKIHAPASTIRNLGTFSIQQEAKTFDGDGLTKLINDGLLQKLLADQVNPDTEITAQVTNGGHISVGAGTLSFFSRVGSVYAGSVYIGQSAMLRFTHPNLTIEYRAPTTIAQDGQVIFLEGTTSMSMGTSSANFSGDGIVSVVGQAVWTLPSGRNLSVSNLAVGPNPADGAGFGTIRGLSDPLYPELTPSVTVGHYLSLTAFRIDRAILSVAPSAVGWLNPVANIMAVFNSGSLLRVQGTVFWTGSDVTLASGSGIWIGGAQAAFNIMTTATMWGPADTSGVFVATGGFLGRLLPAWFPPTTFGMGIWNDGGTIDWTGINAPNRP